MHLRAPSKHFRETGSPIARGATCPFPAGCGDRVLCRCKDSLRASCVLLRWQRAEFGPATFCSEKPPKNEGWRYPKNLDSSKSRSRFSTLYSSIGVNHSQLKRTAVLSPARSTPTSEGGAKVSQSYRSQCNGRRFF